MTGTCWVVKPFSVRLFSKGTTALGESSAVVDVAEFARIPPYGARPAEFLANSATWMQSRLQLPAPPAPVTMRLATVCAARFHHSQSIDSCPWLATHA